MKASQVARRAPVVVVTLRPEDFADTWQTRPDGGVAIGLRTIPDAAEGQARLEAARSTASRCEELRDSAAIVDEYNDALMAAIVGASVCDPNDVSRDPDSLPFAADSVRLALRSVTIRRLFLAIERMRAEYGSAQPEADDAELRRLAKLLRSDILSAVEDVSLDRARRARRLAAALLETIAP